MKAISSDDFVLVERSNQLFFVAREYSENVILTEHLRRILDGRTTGQQQQSGQGRAPTEIIDIGNGVRALTRRGVRGGFFRRFLGETYFRFPLVSSGFLRPIRELQILRYLSEAEVSVVPPVAALIRFETRVSYRFVIATRLIEGAETLHRLCPIGCDSAEVSRMTKIAGREINKMLAGGVFHPDMHPGNVLIKDETAYLLDFDRAATFKESEAGLMCKRLKRRWDRYIDKHQLAAELKSSLAAELAGRV